MSQVSQALEEKAVAKATVDWLTTIAVAAIAACLVQFVHEGTHALTCLLVGADLQEFSALHVNCEGSTVWGSKAVSAAAAIVNIVLGFILMIMLRRSSHRSSAVQFFLWLFMLMNWLVGAGYWMFSGIANVGDWANVINGWQPHWFWRLTMTLIGTASYLFFVWLALKELGKIIGGDSLSEQVKRASKLGVLSYVTMAIIIFLSGWLNAYGIAGLPAVAAMMLALGGMSPLLWMMQWFRAKSFVKFSGEPLAIQRQWVWVIMAAVISFVYVVVLGRGIYF